MGFNPDEIKRLTKEIKKENNITNITNKDFMLYIAHRLDDFVEKIELTRVGVAKNRENIIWTKRCLFGLYGIIGGISISVVLFYLGVI